MSKKSKVSSKKAKDKHKEKKPQKKASKAPVKKAKDKKSSKPVPSKKTPAKKTKSAPKPVSKTKVSKASSPVAKKVKPKSTPKVVSGKAASKINSKKTVKAPVKEKSKKPVTVAKPAQKIQSLAPKVIPSSKNVPAPKPAVKVKEEKVQKAAQPSVFQKAEKKTPEVLAVQNTLPVKTKQEISASKIASISQSITNPVRKTDSYSVKAEKEPSGKFEMEFVIHSSAEMLYEFLSTPSGLSEWFCDDLNIRNGIYTFIWDDQLMQARLLKTSELALVRFQWVDKTDGSYFEFRIQKDDLTNDISLIITDFAETASERESSKLLWQSQIEKLRHVIGSIF
jgi:uncharacterized protein YndB with AHSA1/START domain